MTTRQPDELSELSLPDLYDRFARTGLIYRLLELAREEEFGPGGAVTYGDITSQTTTSPEEFVEARIDGATMIDFYRADFRDALAELDPDASYVLYCRSGNRSGQALEIMRELGFSDVQDVNGGIVSWVDAGLPVVDG